LIPGVFASIRDNRDNHLLKSIMLKKPLTILAISPGTKYLAAVIFVNSELRDWQVKGFKGKWSDAKKAKILCSIKRLIVRYEPAALSIKHLHPSRCSLNLRALVSGIRNLVIGSHLIVREYTLKELEHAFCPGQRGSKRRMSEALVLEYPVLFQELEKERTNKNPYYARLFEAVALGSICHDEMDR
jgi:hypothetical protein